MNPFMRLGGKIVWLLMKPTVELIYADIQAVDDDLKGLIADAESETNDVRRDLEAEIGRLEDRIDALEAE